ncbi:hypothetical protein DL762_007533 [Monosporascus cannonballus]|uniref:Uncharacterized protein n=1 Tax=Monosporascus cannonballus TaxID=155416 RepID=A0ABY0H395_9PEZI|nr:hypothetical protein DL762_007533 [Monosporascus cannonballus]
MAKYWFFLCAVAFVGVKAEDDLSDFSNNLATDIAPLLILFGESMTRQYLSESTSFLDYFIFTMAPIGIITAIVSTIRVCGHPSLRAFIGRPQEGDGAVEAELCTSTSRDVCELFNRGGITRVLGRPKILELVYLPRNGSLRVFQDYLAKPNTETPDHSWWQRDQHVKDLSFAPNPNLSLNVGIVKQPDWVFYTTATIGFVLQTGVLVLAGTGVWILHWSLNGTESLASRDYAPVMFIVGTVMMCGGMWSCAALIGQTTQELRFKRTRHQGIAALRERLPSPNPDDMLSAFTRAADDYRQKSEWERAETVWRWACAHFYSPPGEERYPSHFAAALRATGELYRWSLAQHSNDARKEFGINGVNWMSKNYGTTDQSNREVKEILDQYQEIAQGIAQHPAHKNPAQPQNVNRVDGGGKTPLSWAAENGHEAVVKLLLERGADFKLADNIYGETLLLWAARNGHEAVVKLLLETGADFKSGGAFGQAPLSWATQYGHEVVVQLLFDKGANFESKDNKGRTPQSLAKEYRRETVVTLLNHYRA